MTRRKFQGHKRVDAQTTYHDEAFDRLTAKLYKWLIAQPEWVGILSGPRGGRKHAARTIADMITRIPAYASDPPKPQRAMNIRVGSGEDKAQDQGAVDSPVASHAPDLTPQPDKLYWGEQTDPEGEEKDRLYPPELGGEG